jgi:hypothetical protein
MFIGQQDESSINFARPKGAKDKMPRKKSGLRTAAKVGAGLAGAAAIGAAARYGGSGRAQMGLNRALKGSAMSAREKVDSFRQGAVNAVRSDAGNASARAKKGFSQAKSFAAGRAVDASLAADNLRQRAKNFRNK